MDRIFDALNIIESTTLGPSGLEWNELISLVERINSSLSRNFEVRENFIVNGSIALMQRIAAYSSRFDHDIWHIRNLVNSVSTVARILRTFFGQNSEISEVLVPVIQGIDFANFTHNLPTIRCHYVTLLIRRLPKGFRFVLLDPARNASVPTLVRTLAKELRPQRFIPIFGGTNGPEDNTCVLEGLKYQVKLLIGDRSLDYLRTFDRRRLRYTIDPSADGTLLSSH